MVYAMRWDAFVRASKWAARRRRTGSRAAPQQHRVSCAVRSRGVKGAIVSRSAELLRASRGHPPRSRFVPWLAAVRVRIAEGTVAFDVGSMWVTAWGLSSGSRVWRVAGVLLRSKFDVLWRYDQRRMSMSFLDRVPAMTQNGHGAPTMADEKYVKSYPAIAEFLTAVTYPDGSPRTPSSFTVFWEEGTFKVCLSERDRGLTLWSTGETFQEALATLEKRLQSPRPEWRKGKGKGPVRRS